VPDRRLPLDRPLDLALTLGPLQHGYYDPTIRLGTSEAWRATRSPDGPATLHLRVDRDGVRAEAWGVGAGWALETLPELLGEPDDAAALLSSHPLLVELQRRLPGLRLPRTGRLFEALLPAIIEQKITSFEAQRSYRRLIGAHGERAPGPLRLRLQPSPERLARLPYHAYHEFGLEQRRADAIRRAAAVAPQLERMASRPPSEALRALRSVPGVGPWTAAEAVRIALGDPDAVSVGDFHLPSLVAGALANEGRADDARMLELLEPYRGQRARVVRLLEAGAGLPRRRAPRMPMRRIESI
jgi:3-methyladenine DNA glycosylase/8-oxoguanine DNA glycosylase